MHAGTGLDLREVREHDAQVGPALDLSDQVGIGRMRFIDERGALFGLVLDQEIHVVAREIGLAPAADAEQAVQRIVELVSKRMPRRFGFDPIKDVQVLCPMNRGGVGARSLNVELQAALNPAGEKRVERFGWTFAPGDKVMQIENDYDKDV